MSDFHDFHLWCAERELNPHGLFGQEILSLSCLPIPPSAHDYEINLIGGTYGSRTRLQGFADLCVTAPPTRHPRFIIPDNRRVAP